MKRLLLSIVTVLSVTISFGQSVDLKSILGGLISSDKLSVESLSGTWNYNSPAVTFKSDNILMKAGGSAMASTIESKLAPYYKTAGLESLVVTINKDGQFTMSTKTLNVKGTVTANEDNDSESNFIFNFQAVGKVNIGKVNAYVTKSGTNSMSITFDVSKLMEIMNKVASVSGNSTATSAMSLLNNYDGVCAGFSLTKSK